MKMAANPENERFENGAGEYAAYLETPEGRLRSDLSLANLEDFLPKKPTNKPRYAIDVGCGTGTSGIRLARLGFQVTLLDSSQSMIALAKHTAEEAGVADKVELRSGDANQLKSLLGADSFDVIVCHNVLEFVDNPITTLRDMARALRDSSAVLSILVRSRVGEVLKAALLAGDLEAAETNLTAEWGQESLYGGRVRLFTADSLKAMLDAASLETFAERGVRVIADYLPPSISRAGKYDQIFALERQLGYRPEYVSFARYTQYFAQRAGSFHRNDE